MAVVDSTRMQKEMLKLLVPLTLYFHNDEPDPKTTATVTTKNYTTALAEYVAREQEYLDKFTDGLEKHLKEKASDMITNFFRDSVQLSMTELDHFAALTETLMHKGETVKITMKGYCSPLASTDYNKNLARRRISSLRNYFMEYNGGTLKPYVNAPDSSGGRIIFEDVEIGELKATRASDSFKDKRNSVYSPSAAAERKIQIIAVSFGQQ